MQKIFILNTFILLLITIINCQAQDTKADSTSKVATIKELSSTKKKTKKAKKEKVVKLKITKVSKTKVAKVKKLKPPKTKTKKVAKLKPPKNTPSLDNNEELLIESMPESTEMISSEKLRHPSEIDNCNFAFNVVDEFTGKRKRGLAERQFFTYTPGSYKKFLKKQDFLTCTGYLTESSDGLMALHLKFKILSKMAKAKFGNLSPNSTMYILPMRGKAIALKTFKGAEAQAFDDYTLYECTFAISKGDLATLKKTEVDQVQITWSGGFQVYDVYYLDFLLDQFPCFEEVK